MRDRMRRDRLKLTVFQSDKGDCLLLTGADGDHVLVDGGMARLVSASTSRRRWARCASRARSSTSSTSRTSTRTTSGACCSCWTTWSSGGSTTSSWRVGQRRYPEPEAAAPAGGRRGLAQRVPRAGRRQRRRDRGHARRHGRGCSRAATARELRGRRSSSASSRRASGEAIQLSRADRRRAAQHPAQPPLRRQARPCAATGAAADRAGSR